MQLVHCGKKLLWDVCMRFAPSMVCTNASIGRGACGNVVLFAVWCVPSCERVNLGQTLQDGYYLVRKER